MADERLLKEYEGIKDADTVHLSIKAAIAPDPSPQPFPAAALSPNDATSPHLIAQKSRSDSLSAPFSPSSSMGPPASRNSSTPSRAGHSRVPSITLTTDFSNFSNIAGTAASSPHDVKSASAASPGRGGAPSVHSRSPSLGSGILIVDRQSPAPFAASSGAPASPHSGDSTPLSTPGTPMSGIVGFGRTRSPSITVAIDLENIDMMNPRSSDRTHPVGLSPHFLGTLKDPVFWTDILGLLDARFQQGRKADHDNERLDGEGEHGEETKRVFELWLAASKEWMNASDIARIRDQTGVWGMAGR